MDYDSAVQATIRGLAILLFAFANAVVLFCAVALVVGPVGQGDLEVLRWIAFGMPLLAVPAILQVWMLTGRRLQSAQGWPARLAALRSRTIVVAAMFEAPALLAGVSILLTGFSWHALVGPVLFLAAVAALMPTRSRITRAIGLADGTMPDKYS